MLLGGVATAMAEIGNMELVGAGEAVPVGLGTRWQAQGTGTVIQALSHTHTHAHRYTECIPESRRVPRGHPSHH